MNGVRSRAPRILSLCAFCTSAGIGTSMSVGVGAADLYREDHFRSLVADVKAHRVGDKLTVLVMETSSAASTADTKTQRETDVSASALWDVGRARRTGQATVGLSSDFTGLARTQRAGRLLAQITVTVVGIQGNGDLHIAGEQALEVNNEKQTIRLQGTVRPQDIAEDNAVVSSRIADARIHYAGDGVLAEGQRPGWITRVLAWLGL